MFHRQIRGLSTTAAAATNAATTSTPRAVRKVRANRPIIQEQRQRNLDLMSKAVDAKLEWRTVCSTILHRYPVITPDPKPWETAFHEVQNKIENEHRRLLVKELESTPDALLVEDRSLSKEEILETMSFQPAPRVTEADKNNDRHSLERRLQDSLFLIVRRNRDDFSWQFPQGKVQENETLRSATERILQRTGQVDVTAEPSLELEASLVSSAWIVGNGPVGHYRYAYPAALQEKRQQFGAQVFFTRAQYLGGSMAPVKVSKKLYKDYAWIARDEVHEYFDKETANFLQHLLPH